MARVRLFVFNMSNMYDLSGKHGVGYTNIHNLPFYFDLEDYDKIKEYTWHINAYGYIASSTFKRQLGLTKNILFHRLILNPPDEMHIDHYNHVKFDNRKFNLRICNNQENSQNTTLRSTNKSGVKGVFWNKDRNKWEAYITVHGKKINLGRHLNKDDAILVRKNAEFQYFGSFNFDENQYLVH